MRALTWRFINFIALLSTAGCSSGFEVATDTQDAGSRELTVFAAASLANTFPDLADAFQAEHPGATVIFNFAGSQRLRTQLEFGAKADVFASADQKQMSLAEAAELLLGPPVPFASNRLVVIAPNAGDSDASNANSAVRSLSDLANPDVKVALALPEVPAGGYTRAVLHSLETEVEGLGPGYAQRVLANVATLEPNVLAVVQKVILGEVDAGIVYWTDAINDYTVSRVRVIPIPESANVTALYPLAILRVSTDSELARAFVQFILSEQGKVILQKHGFGPPDPNEASQQPVAPGGR